MYVCMYKSMYVCMYVCMQLCTYVYECMYVCMSAGMYVYIAPGTQEVLLEALAGTLGLLAPSASICGAGSRVSYKLLG